MHKLQQSRQQILVIVLTVLMFTLGFLTCWAILNSRPEPKSVVISEDSSQTDDSDSEVQANPPQNTISARGCQMNLYAHKSPESLDDATKIFPLERTIACEYGLVNVIQEYILGLTEDEIAAGYYFQNPQVHSLEFTVPEESPECMNGGGREFKVTQTDNPNRVMVQWCLYPKIMSSGYMAESQFYLLINNSYTNFISTLGTRFLDRDGKCTPDASGLQECLN